jgi:hypothetical protein
MQFLNLQNTKRAFNTSEFRSSITTLPPNTVMSPHLFKRVAVPDICGLKSFFVTGFFDDAFSRLRSVMIKLTETTTILFIRLKLHSDRERFHLERGRCLAWYDASLGRWRPLVRIRPTPLFLLQQWHR